VNVRSRPAREKGRHAVDRDGRDGGDRNDSDAVTDVGEGVQGDATSAVADELGANASADVNETSAPPTTAEQTGGRKHRYHTAVVYTVLPVVALAVAVAAALLRWDAGTMRAAQTARAESVQAATESAIKMLSYRPDTVEHDLHAARDRMIGGFRDDYTKLTDDVVIPGAKEKQISAVATVPAASSVSATADHAVVLVFVNQTVVVGSDAPTYTASSVKVTMEKHGGQWLMSSFDPV
jgi:Mce-associated membrane protein